MLIATGARVMVAALTLAGAAACTGSSTAPRAAARVSAAPTVVSPSTATGTVVAYYERVARHDAAGAGALLDPGLRRENPTSGVDNIKSLTHIRDVKAVPASYPPQVPRRYVDIMQVVVTFDVVYKQEIASSNGTNIRFVYVGRDGANGPWRILSIGTGP